MEGRRSRCLFAAFTNIAPGVDEARFQSWYFDMHRPDSLALGLFDHSSRWVAATPSSVRYLTLWEAEHGDLREALRVVREGAMQLQEQGRIHPVQTVVFAQFLFSAGSPAPASARETRTLTTLQNDWARPARGQCFDDWIGGVLPDDRSPWHAAYGYAGGCFQDSTAARFLWLGESAERPEALAAALGAGVAAGVPPFGTQTPIFLPPEGEPPPDTVSDDPQARRAAWAVQWTPVPEP